MSRLLLGLSVATGHDAAEAAVVRATGAGLGMGPVPVGFARVPLPPDARTADPPLIDALAVAARQATTRGGVDFRKVLAAGLLGAAGRVADGFAERTGITTVSAFAARDIAAGGTGRQIGTAAEFLLFRDPGEDRVLIHLGSVTAVVFLPAAGKIGDVVGFEAGPGNQFLDGIAHLGSRGRDGFDPGGTRAVQGKCLDSLAETWGRHPFPARRPPKVVPPGAFSGPFVTDAFAAARDAGGTLNDLLCTATHFVAACVGDGVRRWLPAPAGTVPRRVFVSG
ncbi:MAG: anhydro-N-acetylmuramic acid kinase, partial [Fimbriiglobus sp.]